MGSVDNLCQGKNTVVGVSIRLKLLYFYTDYTSTPHSSLINTIPLDRQKHLRIVWKIDAEV